MSAMTGRTSAVYVLSNFVCCGGDGRGRDEQSRREGEHVIVSWDHLPCLAPPVTSNGVQPHWFERW